MGIDHQHQHIVPFFFQMHKIEERLKNFQNLPLHANHQLCQLYIKCTCLWITHAIKVNHMTNFITNLTCLCDDELQHVPKQSMSATSHDQWQHFHHHFKYCLSFWRRNTTLQSHCLSTMAQHNRMLISQCILKQQKMTCKLVQKSNQNHQNSH